MAQVLKRPRAETKTQSSPQHTRVCLGKREPEFTLFDGSELSEIVDTSPFDDQLSDMSESGWELPPLTPSLTGSEVGDGEDVVVLDTPFNIVSSGDWTGTRKPSMGYRLPGDDENLNGPPVQGFDSAPSKLDNDGKEILRKFCDHLTVNWPSQRLSSELAGSRHSAFVDPTGFWYALFQTEFKRFVDFLEAQREGNRSQRLITNANNLLDSLQKEIEEKSPFSAGLLVSVYYSCISYLRKEANEEIRVTLNKSHELGLKIKAARRIGHKCAKRALWIQVMRSDPNPVLHQHMVETNALFNTGKKTGAIDKDAIIVGVPQGWKLIQAPPMTNKQAYSLIFWEPSGTEDCEPTFDKVVGACIHGAEHMSPILADPTSDYIRLQCASAVNSLKNKIHIDRNIKQGGYMTKDSGQQASYGVPYELLPNLPSSTSRKPTRKTIKKMEEQSQLRMDIKKHNAGIQSINFALMQGFLPHFAAAQYQKAMEKKMLNRLGRPNTASFATYAYCAGLHLDKDESVTHGWVIKRGKEVGRRESNFVWGNYKLILELNEGSHWFWRADVDAHGTTTNKLVMAYPGRWKTAAILEEEEIAQWTRVNTIPKAVADATLRSQQ